MPVLETYNYVDHACTGIEGVYSSMVANREKSVTSVIPWFTLLVLLLLGGCQSSLAPSGQRDISFDTSPIQPIIVFVGQGNGYRDLFLLDLITKRVTQLTNSSSYEMNPHFTPDGRAIVYSSAENSNDIRTAWTLKKLDLKTKKIVEITSDSEVADAPLAFSKNGEYLYFLRSNNLQSGVGSGYRWQDQEICRINKDGKGLITLVKNDPDHLVYIEDVHPAGKHFLLALQNEEYVLQLVTFEQDRTIDAKSLSPDFLVEQELGRGSEAKWSKDGTWIAFLSDRSQSFKTDVWLLETDIKKPKQITNLNNWAKNLRFSHDDKRLYFFAGTAGNGHMNRDLWSVPRDGSELIKVADYTLFDDPLNWKPK